jgi:hypothetical protein
MKILVINPQQKHDYLASSIIEGLNNSGYEVYYTSNGNGAINIISDEQFISHYDTCNFIFAIWGKSIFNGVPEPKFYLIDKVNGWHKTVYIDGSEYNYTGFPNMTTDLLHPIFKEKAKWYFKRECLSEHIHLGIIPLPSTPVSADFLNISEIKTIDVLCSFGQSDTGLRKTAQDACIELLHEGYNIITTPISNYLHGIHQAWITIDAHGGGECNARMWQIMANKSCLFAQKYNIVYPYLDQGDHYISWVDKKDLKNKIRYFLGNKEKLSYIISNSYQNIIDNHTSVKRVKYIFNMICHDFDATNKIYEK